MFITKFFISWNEHRKITKILKKAYKDDEIIAKLSHTFGVQFRKDWIGRVYAIINPAIQDGKFNPEQTFEYTELGYNNDEYIKAWTMERLLAMESFLKTNDLFDMLTYELNRIDEYGNHLLILSPVTLNGTRAALNKAVFEMIGLCIGAIIACNWNGFIELFNF